MRQDHHSVGCVARLSVFCRSQMWWHSSHRLDRLYASLYQSMHPLTDSRYNRVLKNVRLGKAILTKPIWESLHLFVSNIIIQKRNFIRSIKFVNCNFKYGTKILPRKRWHRMCLFQRSTLTFKNGFFKWHTDDDSLSTVPPQLSYM